MGQDNKNRYRFRIKFKLPRNDYFDFKVTTEPIIPFPDEIETITLKTLGKPEKKKVMAYTLNGGPYETEEKAKEMANRALNALFLYAVKTGRGIDIGFNAPKSVLTGYGQEYFSKKTGFKVLSDVYGIHVYPVQDRIKFMSVEANASVGYSIRAFVNCITQGYAITRQLNKNDLLAIEMYCSSFFENTINARFLSLMISVESMLEFTNHSDQVKNVIQDTITDITALDINQYEKESVLGSLNYLKKISITKAGILLAEKYLGNEKIFLGLSPADFFKKCYNLRSNLVHYGKRMSGEYSIEKVTPNLVKFTGTLIERKM